MMLQPPPSTLFPYTTLFRSADDDKLGLKLTTAQYLTPGDISIQGVGDRKSTRLNSSHVSISYAVFCLKKKSFANARGSFNVQIRRQRDLNARDVQEDADTGI